MLNDNKYALNYANGVMRGCIGDCIDILCDPADETMDEVLERPEFKTLYSDLLRYSIFCETGLSQGTKAGEVVFQGDEHFAGVDLARGQSKKKRLKENITNNLKSFNDWFNAQNYRCAAKPMECGCKVTCGCNDKKTDLGCGLVAL